MSKKSSVEPQDGDIPCFRCGVCCIRYQVRVSRAEAQQIAEQSGITLDEWLERYADKRLPGVESVLIRQQRGACVFLERTGRNQRGCSINAIKPASCQEWKAGLQRWECQEGLLKYWRLKVDTAGKLKGSDGELSRFRAFLKSLQ